MLPLGTDLAGGTLRVLARRQGTRVDPATGEAPGKILHELRRHEFALAGNGLRLPPAYYGTVDATLLWVNLLHDAWRWGMPAEEVEPLLPHLRGGAGLARPSTPTPTATASSSTSTPPGTAWPTRAGRTPATPSGSATAAWPRRRSRWPRCRATRYQAAVNGGGPARRLRPARRAALARLRRPAGRAGSGPRSGSTARTAPYPALALDRDKRPVDSLTSNIGHLLGTGLLAAPRSPPRSPRLLGTPALAGGFGLRTMSTEDAGFSPLSYHCGSIWAHDTAIVLAGLARAGLRRAGAQPGRRAARRGRGVRLPAARAVRRGRPAAGAAGPVPYPAACRPQAWAAAARCCCSRRRVGLYPDVPAGRVEPASSCADVAVCGAVTARVHRVGRSLGRT